MHVFEVQLATTSPKSEKQRGAEPPELSESSLSMNLRDSASLGKGARKGSPLGASGAVRSSNLSQEWLFELRTTRGRRPIERSRTLPRRGRSPFPWEIGIGIPQPRAEPLGIGIGRGRPHRTSELGARKPGGRAPEAGRRRRRSGESSRNWDWRESDRLIRFSLSAYSLLTPVQISLKTPCSGGS